MNAEMDTTPLPGSGASIQATQQNRSGRGRGWSAVAFAVLYVAGFLPLGELLGSFGDSDATFVAYFEKDSNRIGAVFGGIGLGLAGLVFFWFLSNLRLAVAGPGPLPGVVSAAGTTFVVLMMSGVAALVAVPYARTFGGAYGEDAILVGTEALLPQMGYVLLTILAMWSAAALILAVTLSGRSHDAFPRWLARLGFAASAFVFLLGPSVMGVLGVPVWALGVGIHWFRGGDVPGGDPLPPILT